MDYAATNLACRRGDRTVLAGLSFSVAAGKALILRGANGSGKTTLLRCLAGLTPPVAGSLSFAADDVAYAAHDNGLKAQLRVAETIEFWASIYGATDTAPAVDAFTLSPLMTRHVAALSAGQKRRLSLSRLLLTGRPLWALDEPTVSLDSATVTKFADAVRAHLAQGRAAIIATHIDLGLDAADVLDVSGFKPSVADAQDPFLDGAFT